MDYGLWIIELYKYGLWTIYLEICVYGTMDYALYKYGLWTIQLLDYDCFLYCRTMDLIYLDLL
jgi:uncharacterized membrane protein YpjA